MTAKLLTAVPRENIQFVTNEQRSAWIPTSDFSRFNSCELQPFVYIGNDDDNNNNNNNNNNSENT
jgi:hypothetical protein